VKDKPPPGKLMSCRDAWKVYRFEVVLGLNELAAYKRFLKVEQLHADVVHMAEYVDGLLQAEHIPALEEHLAVCAECREVLSEMRLITEPISLEEIRNLARRNS